MPSTNGTPATSSSPPSANGKPRQQAKSKFARNPTAGYRPSAGGSWWGYPSSAIDNQPAFTWFDIPRMLRDPQVRFIERLWRAPFQQAKWAVKAETDKIAQFVSNTLRRFWRRSLPKILSRYFRYGFAPGGAEFVARRGWLRFERVRAVEPRDATPLEWTSGPNRGMPAGFTLAGMQAGRGDWVAPPHAFWFAGHAELSTWYDRPPLADLFSPWLEKNGRQGAIQSRRLYHRRAAWRDKILYYPDGTSLFGPDENPQSRNNEDVAREILDYSESGSAYLFKNDKHPSMEDFAWKLVDASVLPEVAGMRDYPKDLDEEMMRGAGIPPEVAKASETGSGYSGRLVPYGSFLDIADEFVGLVLEACETWLRPLVAANFGPESWYEVEPLSLSDQVKQESAPGGGGGGPQSAGAMGLLGGSPSPAPVGGSGASPLSLSATIPDDLIRRAEKSAGKVHKYVSTHIDLSRELAQQIRLMAARVSDADLEDKGRETEPHITIRYGLLDEDPDEVARIFADAGPVEYKLGAVSVFDSVATGKDYDVVKVDAESTDLRRLNRELASLPHHDTHPEYHPHATIAYVRAGEGAKWARRLGRMDAEGVASEAVFSAKDGFKTVLPFASGFEGEPIAREMSVTLEPTATAAPAPAKPTGGSTWTPYIGKRGPRAGQQVGWISNTGEVRYQESQPGATEGGDKGPESLFNRPDYAHVPEHTSAAEPRDPTQIRTDAHAAAEAAGLDPTELHHRAAEHLDRAITDTSEIDKTRWTPAQHLAHHEAQEKIHRAEAGKYTGLAEQQEDVAAKHRAGEARNREYIKLIGTAGVADSKHQAYADDLVMRAKSAESAAAGHRTKAASALTVANEHAVGAAKIRGGYVPPVASSNNRNLLAGVYKDAHRDLTAEKESRDEATHFADTYFEHERPVRRAAKYLKAVADGSLDVNLLPEGTRADITEDLAQLPPAKLAAHVAELGDTHGNDTTEFQMARAAVQTAAAAHPPKPLPFDGNPDGYFLVSADEVDDRHKWAGFTAAAQLLPGAKAPLDNSKAILVKTGTPLAKIINEDHGIGYDLTDENGLSPLFSSLKTPYLLPQSDVPASAKDYGGTSGSKGSGEYTPEESWDADAVPVYRRVNEDWYVKMRSAGDEDSEPYELVNRKDVPHMARLPDVYWSKFDPTNSGTRDDLVERTAVKEAKASDEGATQKKDLKTLRRDIKKQKSDVGKLKTAWNQALKGVPEDERPDEPDWDAVDASELGSDHGSREDHRDTVAGISEEYGSHIDALKDEVETAKEHGANHRENAAASDKAKKEWESTLADVSEDDRPTEPDWRDDLGGDTEHHAKWLAEKIKEAKETAAKHGATAHADLAKHTQAWRDTDAKIQGWLDIAEKTKERADADDSLNDEINNELPAADDIDPDDFGEDDEVSGALEEVRDTLSDLEGGETPSHEDGPDPDEYDHAEEDEIPDEDYGTARERAEAAETAAGEHHDRLVELADVVRKHKEGVHAHSKEWRATTRLSLEHVGHAINAALAIPAEQWTEASGGDAGAATAERARLTEARAKVTALLAKAADHPDESKPHDTPTEMSVTVGPDDDDSATQQQAAASIPAKLMRSRKAVLARLLTLAMVRKQQEATESGNPQAAAGSIASLAGLASNANEVARIVGMKGFASNQAPEPDSGAVEMSWAPYIGRRGARAGQQVGWVNTENLRDIRYQAAKPGELKEKRGASAEAGLAIAKKVLAGTANGADVTELATHLPVMTTARLKNVRNLLDATFKGARRKDRMVQALIDHVGKMVPPESAKSPATATASTEPSAEPAAVAGTAPAASEPAAKPALVKSSPPLRPPVPKVPKELPDDAKRPAKASAPAVVPTAESVPTDRLTPTKPGRGKIRLKAAAEAERAAKTKADAEEEASRVAWEPASGTGVTPTPAASVAPRSRGKRKSLWDDPTAVKTPTHTGVLADGTAVPFVPHPVASGGHAPNYATVAVDPQKLNTAWSKDAGYYIPPGGGGAEIGGRRARFEKFLATGEPVQAPHAVLSGDTVGFEDGRHRFSVLRDKGINRVPVTVSKDQATEFENRFGTAAESGTPSASAVPSVPMNEPVPVPPPLVASPPPVAPQPAPEPEPVRVPTDRGSLDSIKESTDRALGIKAPVLPTVPNKGEYGAWLRAAAADPAKMVQAEQAAALPTVDRAELLKAVGEVYGPAIHEQAKKMGKGRMIQLIATSKAV